jgi:hypothetical protein
VANLNIATTGEMYWLFNAAGEPLCAWPRPSTAGGAQNASSTAPPGVCRVATAIADGLDYLTPHPLMRV